MRSFVLLLVVLLVAGGWWYQHRNQPPPSPAPALQPPPPTEDFTYIVIKKEHIKGELRRSNRIHPMTKLPELERIDPAWRIWLKGQQTGREYPAVEVMEWAYDRFTIGSVYNREQVHRARR